jgi:UDP-N-acetylglucosamine 2-epimerase (non-hydrolysing)
MESVTIRGQSNPFRYRLALDGLPGRGPRSARACRTVTPRDLPDVGPGPAVSHDEVVVIVGTRPEAIKVAGIVAVLGTAARLVHTGQHYDPALWRDVVADLPGLSVRHSLRTGGVARGEQIGSATTQLTGYLMRCPARAVVVQGDTNSTLAGALAAQSLGLPVVHVEAGLRSHDRTMPEEINRLLVDAIADLCCAPTRDNADQLQREGVTPDRIKITGSTLIDAMTFLVPGPDERARVLADFDVRDGDYALATLHRAGNVDDAVVLARFVEAFARLGEQTTVLMPVHPRTEQQLRRAGLLPRLANLKLLPPLAPRQFLSLEAHARLIVSDSGGVQEEACLLRRPLIVMRDSTERPELLDGWCRLLGDADPVEEVARAWQDSAEWGRMLTRRPLPYPQWSASDVIVAEIERRWPPMTEALPLPTPADVSQARSRRLTPPRASL